ncbi:hypothetical protein [Streptomyces sp. NPDC048442]|uniref:hypothetical protein n=1 Tax=Streptomyces sp. NPDC048442 TaxID=3154823 RepID=UPI0034218F75
MPERGACFFQYKNGGGLLWVVPSCGKNPVPGVLRPSSVWNKGGSLVDLYSSAGPAEYLGTVPRGWQGDLSLEQHHRVGSVDVRC